MFSKTAVETKASVFSPNDKTKMKDSLRKKLTTLLPSDEKFLKEAEEIVAKKDQKRRIEFSDEILSEIDGPCNPSAVVRLCSQSKAFMSLCLDEKLPHFERWSQYLKGATYIGENIQSIDKSTSSTVGEEYIGSYVYYFYKKMARMEKRNYLVEAAMLEVAADFGAFWAIQEMIKQKAEAFKSILLSGSATSDERKAAEDELVNACDKFCNQYWSVGYLFVSIIYRNIGIAVGNASVQGEGRDDLRVAGDVYRLKGYESFLRAKEYDSFKKLSENKNVIDTICEGEGLSVFGAGGWEEGEQSFLKHLRKSLYPVPVILDIKKRIKEEVLAIMTARQGGAPRAGNGYK